MQPAAETKNNDAEVAAPAADVLETPAVEQQQAADEGGKTLLSEDPAPAEGEATDEPTGPPETYEFLPPEGQSYDEAVIAAFSDAAREASLTQEAASNLLSKVAPVLAERTAQQLQAQREAQFKQWADAAKADKELGGPKLAENLATAKTALEQFGSPELVALLNESGLGNHPDMIRAWKQVGDYFREDTVLKGQSGETEEKPLAKRLYPGLA